MILIVNEKFFKLELIFVTLLVLVFWFSAEPWPGRPLAILVRRGWQVAAVHHHLSGWQTIWSCLAILF